MEISLYKLFLFGCAECQRDIHPSEYRQLAYDREGGITVFAVCKGCKEKIKFRYNVDDLTVRASKQDGFTPTKH